MTKTSQPLMKNRIVKKLATFAAGMLVSATAFASGGGNLLQSGTDLGDRASLQRGAQLYMNYCSGCHSLKYLRYSRLAEDLGLTEDEVMNNLNFTGAKFGEQIQVSLTPEHANQWFGKMPPDLSVISRVRGSDWIYTYLKSFYLDEARPLGWNNALFPNASMPNPLWQMQGTQTPKFTDKEPAHGLFGEKKDDKGKPIMECPHGTSEIDGKCFTKFEAGAAGTLEPEQFNQSVRDITAFLEYAGEPAALKRESLGVWVILFLAVFTFLAYLLKSEYWRDVEH